jgi:hypothetical protein
MDDLVQPPKLPKLKADITRCHDHGCNYDTTCLRYLLRDHGVTDKTSHIESCVPYDVPLRSFFPLLLTTDDF